jgi:3-oxoacyl-[acyl-carrier protein] reductase
MSDFLLDNQAARRVIKTLGLPVPVPPRLPRARGPWVERPLHDQEVVVGRHPGPGAVGPMLASILARAGAAGRVTSSELLPAFTEAGEAYGRPAKLLDLAELPEGLTAHAHVFDATAIDDPSDLRSLYEFFHPLAYRLAAGGRAIVIGRSPSGLAAPGHRAAQSALEGFVRSLAKEVGKRGSTANLLYVDADAEDRLEGPMRFLLSARSAFVSGQPLFVSSVVRKTRMNGSWTRPLENRVALVTGAARGIGAATAALLADEGAHVVCLDRPQDDALASQIARKIGGSVLLADVAADDAPALIARELEQRHGGVDIVVHNAGITRDKTLAKMRVEQWDQTIDINLRAIVRITEALLDGPLHDDGRLVLLSSVAGIAGNMGQTNYAASKAGVLGYTEALAPTVAERGITVNAIAPGFIETRLTAAIPVVIREVGRRLSNLGQGGLPRDIGDAVVFLASPGASGITGNILRVCGGALIGK